MNEKEVALYIRLLAIQARSLPLVEGVPFLKVALEFAGEHPAVKDLRGTYRDMVSALDQLEALGGQLKLSFDGNGKDGQ